MAIQHLYQLSILGLFIDNFDGWHVKFNTFQIEFHTLKFNYIGCYWILWEGVLLNKDTL